MKTIFTKDITHKKMFVSREFLGSIDEVWDAWTDSSVLDQWWAPLPWKAETKKMEFRNGGSWLYAMVGPNGEKHWAKAEYRNIDMEKGYDATDAFCDENGVINPEMPRMDWKLTFKPSSNGTTVDIEITFGSQKDLEQIVEMGFEQGFDAAHENLDRYLQMKLQSK